MLRVQIFGDISSGLMEDNKLSYYAPPSVVVGNPPTIVPYQHKVGVQLSESQQELGQ